MPATPAARHRKKLHREGLEYNKTHVDVRVALDDQCDEGTRVVALVRDLKAGHEYIMSICYGEGFSAPVVRCHTPSPTYELGNTICLSGVTHYHSEEWDPITPLAHVVDSVAMPLLDEGAHADVYGGVGILSSRDGTFTCDTTAYNATHNARLRGLLGLLRLLQASDTL